MSNYIRQTVTISHYIVADETITEEVQRQIAAEVRGFIHGDGKGFIKYVGQALSMQAARDEEPRPEILVTVSSEEITEGELVENHGEN